MEIILLLIISIIVWLVIYLIWKKITRIYKHINYSHWEIFIDAAFLISSLVNLLLTGQLFTVILDARFEDKLDYYAYLWVIAFVFFWVVMPWIISLIRTFLYKKYLWIQVPPLFTTISYIHSLVWGIVAYTVASNLYGVFR